MSAIDLHHDIVRDAIQKAGWKITHDPFRIEIGDVKYQIDLGAEELFAADLQDRKIAIEVKTMLTDSPLFEFHAVLGQFINYR